MVVDALVKGRSGHAGRNEGENAIIKAMEEIGKLTGIQFTDHSTWLPDPSVKVTMISAGTVHNMIPDECRFVLDIRSNDLYSNETILQMLKDVSVAGLSPRSTRLQARALPAGHQMNRVLEKLQIKSFGSSTLSDMALLPFPTVKIGPGDSARSHTAGEWISTQEIDTAIGTYEAIGRELMQTKVIQTGKTM